MCTKAGDPTLSVLSSPALVHQVIAYPLSSHLQGAQGALKAATTSCAELFNMSGQVGKLAPGAFAGVKLSAVLSVVTLDLLGWSAQHTA